MVHLTRAAMVIFAPREIPGHIFFPIGVLCRHGVDPLLTFCDHFRPSWKVPTAMINRALKNILEM